MRNALPRLPLPAFTLHNFDDVDRGLREWRSRLEIVDDNLRELDDEPTLRKLEGRPGIPALILEGDTAARVGPALRALRDVWAYRDRLADAIERAEELRKSVAFKPWAEGKQMRAIDEVLNGPSVVLLGATIPLALRGLASTAQEQNTVTPAGLLEAMESAFANARDAVFAVDAAWTALLPSVVQSGRELEALRVQAQGLDVSLDAEFARVAGALDRVRHRAEHDPLGALKITTVDLQPLLESIRARLAALQQARASVAVDLASAPALLEQLATANATARDARVRALVEIVEPIGLLPELNDGQIEGLRPWLATLQDTAKQGNWSAARVGLDRWLAAASAYATTAEQARKANSASLNRRDELAGLLRARGAQAADLARRGLYLAPEAEAAARRAKALLKEVPCRLAEVEVSIHEFDAAVSGLAHTTRQPQALIEPL